MSLILKMFYGFKALINPLHKFLLSLTVKIMSKHRLLINYHNPLIS